MVSESILFAPEIDDRQLDREVRNVDDQLNDAGTINPEIGDVQGDLDLGGSLSGGMSGMRGSGPGSPLRAMSGGIEDLVPMADYRNRLLEDILDESMGGGGDGGDGILSRILRFLKGGLGKLLGGGAVALGALILDKLTEVDLGELIGDKLPNLDPTDIVDKIGIGPGDIISDPVVLGAVDILGSVVEIGVGDVIDGAVELGVGNILDGAPLGVSKLLKDVFPLGTAALLTSAFPISVSDIIDQATGEGEGQGQGEGSGEGSSDGSPEGTNPDAGVDVGLPEFLGLGAGGVGLSALISKIAGGGAAGGAGFLGGGTAGALSAASLGPLALGAGGVVGTAAGGRELAEIAGGGEGIGAVRDAGAAVGEAAPGVADTIESVFTSERNPVFAAGKDIGQGGGGGAGGDNRIVRNPAAESGMSGSGLDRPGANVDVDVTFEVDNNQQDIDQKLDRVKDEVRREYERNLAQGAGF